MTACENRPSDDTLRRLYEDEYKTAKQIASIYDCSTSAVNRWLHEAGVVLSHRRRHDTSCRVCGVALDDTNWAPSAKKCPSYICIPCAAKVGNAWDKNHKDKRLAYDEKSRRKHGVLPIYENKACGMYLGIHVAERVVSKVFDTAERMPHNNPGYDFVCNKGKKVDVKSTCARIRGGSTEWGFGIARNVVADYFLCIAFDDREQLNPMYIWLLPGCLVSHLTVASICASTIDKWDKYAIDIDNIVSCCDEMRTI